MQKLMYVDLRRPFPRKFVPASTDVGNWEEIEPLFNRLLDRKPRTVEEMEGWIHDCSELSSVIAEERTKRYIAMTLQTDDPVREASYQHFVEHIDPKVKPMWQALEVAYLNNPTRKQLSKDRYGVFDRIVETNVKLFREENVPLETQENLLDKDYQKLTGAMTVTYQGNELTLQQASKYFEEPARQVRQDVWELVTNRRLQDREKMEDLYDQLIELRGQIAKNADFDNYRDYVFRRRRRFDYSPEDCFKFHEGVERAVLPVVRQIMEDRRRKLRVDRLRPWDMQVDPLNRPPLRPFATAGELVRGTQEIFNRVDPELGAQFQFMADEQLLELESRKGKAPGGYQSTLHERRWPFIFMNAVGRDDDVRTLLHEGGHAFHMLAARAEPIIYYRNAPLEFSEVASMGMELLAAPHLDVFYANPDEYRRAYINTLHDAVLILPWVATVDAFQHWVYTHPGHSREERKRAWLKVFDRFNPFADWTGYDDARAYRWHAQLHIFIVPFYYIEYGIAEVGALQVWTRARRNHREAVERYWQALALGGSRPLPELFQAAGAKFRFDEETVKPLMEAVQEELATLDDAGA